jgi:hypothetical protein
MNDRLFRDIRYYENTPSHYIGDFDGIIGNVYKITNDTKNIGQRIARKLNELGFMSKDYDHIYINLCPIIDNDKIVVSNRHIYNWYRHIDYGIKPNLFNSLSDSERDSLIKKITFKVLHFLYNNDNEKIVIIKEVQNEMDKLDRQIKIRFKSKETNSYRIDIYFQICPFDNVSKIIIDFMNKVNNFLQQKIFDIDFYEEIYYLIDKINVSADFITLEPKKSERAKFAIRNYKTPIKIDLKNDKIN